jgi:hypothetical protein
MYFSFHQARLSSPNPPPTETRKVVHHPLTKRESKDHQRCLPACACTPNENVQLPGVQRSANFTSPLAFTNTGYPDSKIVYRRYASLFFIAGCASKDNELITLEIVHRYVEQMDKYYGNVCELDIVGVQYPQKQDELMGLDIQLPKGIFHTR